MTTSAGIGRLRPPHGKRDRLRRQQLQSGLLAGHTGATSYNILRTTTSGELCFRDNGVIGPYAGSGLNNTTYLDTSAANGTTIYI